MKYVKYLVKMVRLLCSTGWGGSIPDRPLLVGGAASCFHDDEDAEDDEDGDYEDEEEENDAEGEEVPKYYCQWTLVVCQKAILFCI